tara:strand:- start:666 stop:1310 length:645 start_codon:yes stop_codon:yes gene_type:complete
MAIQRFIEKKISSNRTLVKKLKNLAKNLGFNLEYWHRYITYKQIKKDINFLNIESLDVLEISAGEYWKENYKFKSFNVMNFPEYDICSEIITEKKYDLIIADNVWEHLKYPYRASKNVLKMLNKNGYFLMITPFLVRVHKVPIDCNRWTEDGMKYFLNDCGFKLENIFTNSWGNKKCVISDLRTDDTWTRVGIYRDMSNNKLFPLQVWALAKKD